MGANSYRLQPAQLYRRTDLSDLGFDTTDDLADLNEVIGQPRAVDAIRFGTGIKSTGFNIYAAGPEGLDKRDLVRLHFEAQARGESTPPDWCYVHNLVEEHRPLAIALPAGSGTVFRRDMEALVQEARAALSAAFDSEEYQSRRQSVNEEFRDRQSDAFELLQQRASAEGLALIRTPGGVAVAPVRDGEVLSPDEIQKLPEETQKALQEKVEALAWEAAKAGFTWFLSSGLTDYRLVYGSLASVVVLLLWIYISAAITLFGAHLTAAIDRRPSRLTVGGTDST